MREPHYQAKVEASRTVGGPGDHRGQELSPPNYHRRGFARLLAGCAVVVPGPRGRTVAASSPRGGTRLGRSVIVQAAGHRVGQPKGRWNIMGAIV